jgi:proline iminopeptidase
MSGHRPDGGRLPLSAAAAALVGYGVFVRPRLLNWGATGDEAARAYPGDELIPEAESSSTMATTLPAPPADVWPWLLQMGCNRGGWYSWDWFDNGGKPSAERIVPEWQSLEEGQHLEAAPSGDTWFTVAVLVPERTLVLHAQLELPSGRPFDVRYGPLPGAYVDSVWGFHLQPASAGGTRLVVRTRGRSRPRTLTRAVDFLFWEPAHLVMQTCQFRNLRARLGAQG